MATRSSVIEMTGRSRISSSARAARVLHSIRVWPNRIARAHRTTRDTETENHRRLRRSSTLNPSIEQPVQKTEFEVNIVSNEVWKSGFFVPHGR
jgi:hypothetical protein